MFSEKVEAFERQLESIKHDRYIGSDGIERELQHYYYFVKNTSDLGYNIFATDEIKSIINPIYLKLKQDLKNE